MTKQNKNLRLISNYNTAKKINSERKKGTLAHSLSSSLFFLIVIAFVQILNCDSFLN
jgi:hypothetical protein